jgi:hypothetical protein
VMTSNIGHSEKSKRSMGFVPKQEPDSEDLQKVSRKTLAP